MQPQKLRSPAIRIDQPPTDAGGASALADDVRRGLTRRRRSLPPKYFYDRRGGELFEAICRTPEYYLTRTETRLLKGIAGEVIDRVRPRDLVELGPGSSMKTRMLLDAIRKRGTLEAYVPVDVNREMVKAVTEDLVRSYPGLRVHGVAGDFQQHIDKISSGEPRLVAFLGSTIGNFTPSQAVRFLARMRGSLGPRDALLLGADLVKGGAILHAAYNDAQGVTAEFNRNILRVINRRLGGEFRPERFEHVAFFNRRRSRIEMHLESTAEQDVRIRKLGLTIAFRRGERIRTEYSYKFRRSSLKDILRKAGMRIERLYTDPRGWFALVLARAARGRPAGRRPAG